MALERKRISEIPTDAVILTEEEAFKYQTRVLNNWKNNKDIFAYKYGSVVLGTCSILSGAYINNYFRNKYKLAHYGRIASYLPICAVPGTLSVLVHQAVVLRQLVLRDKMECPVCLELRASLVQSTFGCLMPLLLAPLSSIALVHRYFTFDMPYVTKEPRKVFEILRNQIKPIKNILLGIFIGQALLGSIVTYFEAQSIYKVSFRLTQLEKELEFSDKV